MMKLFRLSRSPLPEYSDHASWTTRGHFSMGLVAEYFGRPVVLKILNFGFYEKCYILHNDIENYESPRRFPKSYT